MPDFKIYYIPTVIKIVGRDRYTDQWGRRENSERLRLRLRQLLWSEENFGKGGGPMELSGFSALLLDRRGFTF